MPPYQYGNPMNDFYIRQAQQLAQNQPQFQQAPQHQYQPLLQFPQPAPQAQPQIITSIVTNIEEAKATKVDPFTACVFIDTSNGKIYLKQFANDGTSSFLTYAQEQPQEQEMSQDPVEAGMTALDRRLENIECGFGNFGNGATLGYATSAEVQRGFDNQNTMANQREALAAITNGTAQSVAAAGKTIIAGGYLRTLLIKVVDLLAQNIVLDA